MAVDIQTSPTFRVGRPQELFQMRSSLWDAAPDGKRFLAIKAPETPAGGAKLAAVVNWFEELRRRVPK